MGTFKVKYRKTGPVTVDTVDAETHEQAVAKIVEQLAEGEEVDVMKTEEEMEAVTPAAG